MAYETKELETEAIQQIEKHKLFFISDVISYLPCSRQTFYDHKLDKLDSIKEALTRNKVSLKVSLRSKWFNSDTPTLQIGLYKLLATEEERRRLSLSHQKIEVEGEVNFKVLNIDPLSDDEPETIEADWKPLED